MTKSMQALPITHAPHGHILTNINVWSPDSEWIVYDVRSDEAGSRFDGDSIQRVHVRSGRVELLYRSQRGASCGVVTYAPQSERVVFILGPENPSAEWPYAPYHRRGVEVETARPGEAIPLDAMTYEPPFVPGALRGGSHVHVYSSDERFVSFTYEDHLLAVADRVQLAGVALNQRNVGIAQRGVPVQVEKRHPRNHDGGAFSVLVSRTTDAPRVGSDEIQRAFEDAWLGERGYVLPDGRWNRYGLVFLGECLDSEGRGVIELFVADLCDEVVDRADASLCGTVATRPSPPDGVRQRRLTFTLNRRFPGVRGPRHWPRSHPDGSHIATLMLDEQGQAQIMLVNAQTGELRQLTAFREGIMGAFSWSPDGDCIACLCNHRVCVIDARTGQLLRATETDGNLRPEACVFSPDGRSVAFVSRLPVSHGEFNQIMVANLN